RERTEPAFDEVHPRPVRGREVQVEAAAVAQQPAVHGRRLVDGEVVQDDVYGEVVGDLAVDLVQERHEVRAGVAGADVGDDLARRDLQGGEQVAGAVPLIVM